MTSWQREINNSITNSRDLANELTCNKTDIDAVSRQYPFRIPPYYLKLIKNNGLSLLRQAVPDILELNDTLGMEDPLGEENLSPVPNLVHKYPDRALFLVCSECAMYCRFCTRKRKVGTKNMVITSQTINQGIEYLENNPAIREVLVSGGDPLLLSDDRLETILQRLKSIPSVEVIRIGTRVPCTLPMRITPALVAMLKKFHPLYVNTHFNHPAEITPEAELACTMLVNAGIPVGCQTVLLRGVNDHHRVMKELLLKLLRMRVKPYYLFQMDLTRGTGHFRTSIDCGLEIMKKLIGHVSGMAIPTYALDAPGGKGKIPLTPDYMKNLGNNLDFINYQGLPCSYPNQTSADKKQ